MFPYFTLFGKNIGLYPIMTLAGIFVAGIFFCRQVKKAGKDDNDAISFLLWSSLGVFLGGSVLYSLTNIEYYAYFAKVHNLPTFLKAMQIVFGGAVFYGGLIGGSLVGLFVMHKKKLDKSLYLDLSALFIPLFHGIARVGCFLGGCCYGIESEFGFTAHGNDISPAVNDVCRFPVQLLETAGNLLIFALLFYLYRKRKMVGSLIYLYLGLYAILRFCDEFLRGDEVRGFVIGWLSTSQFISIFAAAIALVGLIIRYKKRTEQKKHKIR